MNTKTLFITAIALSIFLSSCIKESIRASDEISIRSVSFSDYSALKVSDAFKVYITFSDTEEDIKIEANDNIQEYIIMKKLGNKLTVEIKDFINIRGKETLNIYITTKNITDYDISGASEIVLENSLVAQDSEIELSGASTFSGEVAIENLKLNFAGAANADLYGNIDLLDVMLSGASELRDYDLMVKELDIKLSGASDTFLSVSETMSINASGASSFNYKGNATITNESLSGSSKITKRD